MILISPSAFGSVVIWWDSVDKSWNIASPFIQGVREIIIAPQAIFFLSKEEEM